METITLTTEALAYLRDLVAIDDGENCTQAVSDELDRSLWSSPHNVTI